MKKENDINFEDKLWKAADKLRKKIENIREITNKVKMVS